MARGPGEGGSKGTTLAVGRCSFTSAARKGAGRVCVREKLAEMAQGREVAGKKEPLGEWGGHRTWCVRRRNDSWACPPRLSLDPLDAAPRLEEPVIKFCLVYTSKFSACWETFFFGCGSASRILYF